MIPSIPILLCAASLLAVGPGAPTPARAVLERADDAAAGARAHPQDGPDADVRVRIGDEGVHFSMILNLAFVDEIVDAPREDPDAIHPVEEGGIRDALFEYFREQSTVAIDGLEVTPLDVGFEVGAPEYQFLPLFPLMGMRALLKVRLDLEYPALAPPEEVRIVWPAYPRDLILMRGEDAPLTRIRVVAQVFSRGLSTQVEFSESEPEYVWHDSGATVEDLFLVVPESPAPPRLLLSAISSGLVLAWIAGAALLLARGGRRRWRLALGSLLPVVVLAWLLRGAALLELPSPWQRGPRLPEAEQALAIFRPLHANIYRAFDYVEESDVYDALERSVAGPLLDRLYNEIYQSLIMQEEGGAVSRVQAVRLLETEVGAIGVVPGEERPSFELTARWQVDGAVFHWGHSHERTNEYRARYTVAAGEGGWRIDASETLEQRRVEASALSPEPAGEPLDPEIQEALSPWGDL